MSALHCRAWGVVSHAGPKQRPILSPSVDARAPLPTRFKTRASSSSAHQISPANRHLSVCIHLKPSAPRRGVPLVPSSGACAFDQRTHLVHTARYAAGEKIADHDVALSYVLVHHPELLPSYKGLPIVQQESVRFAHCKMEYNMGWLVQAEAPPGAMFQKLREVTISGQAKDTDVAFYFVHWFVDLAGAEPWPMEGCEKFVLRFPQRVLMQFLSSFGVVQEWCVAHRANART